VGQVADLPIPTAFATCPTTSLLENTAMQKYLAAFLLLISLTSSALSQGRDPAAEYTRNNPKFLGAFKEAIARPSVSTVRIYASSKEIALGVVVGPDGWILTKANDLQGPIMVGFRGGKAYDAEIVGIHVPNDLALLKIDARGLIPVEFKESKTADVGSWVACVGLYDEPVAIGVVSVATRKITNLGPALNIDKMPYLGVALDAAKGGGVTVKELIKGMPAEKAGLKVNDVITAIGGVKVDSPDSFMQTLGKNKPGDVVTLSILRGEEKLEQPATLAKRPPSGARGDIQNKKGSDLSTRRSGYPTILQHDSVVRPIDCGGPIVDLEGRVVGINICRAGRVESWAVPSEIIQPILLELMSGKLAPKADALAAPRLSPDEKLAQAKAAVLKAEREKNRFEKEIDDARQALKAAEAEAKAYRQKDSAEAADRLLRIMQKRLLAMNEVAGWKWNHRVEILDSAREKDSLAKIAARAKELNIDAAAATRFFQAQLEASRLLQQDAIAGWQKDNVLASAKGDLAKDLRPRIDQINEELLQTFGDVLRYWPDAELAIAQRIQRQSPQTLAGPGINDAVRGKAIAGLTTP
jgi:serine protease Do